MMLSTKKFAEKKGLTRQAINLLIQKRRITAVNLNENARRSNGEAIRALYRIPESELAKI